MKNYSTFTILAICAGILFSSCGRIENITVSKRHYRSGFYVDLGSQGQKEKTPVVAQAEPAVATESIHVTTADVPSAVITPKNENVPQVATASIPEKKHLHANHVYASNQANVVDQKMIQQESITEHANALTDVKAVERNNSSDMPQWALILFAIILPPLAVGLKFGIVTQFWISILLTLLFWIPGVIYALILILQ